MREATLKTTCSRTAPCCQPVSRPCDKADAVACGATGPPARLPWAADAGGHLNADDAVLAAIALRSFCAQFVQSFQIMLVDRRYRGAVFCSLNKCTERVEQFQLLIRHDQGSIGMNVNVQLV